MANNTTERRIMQSRERLELKDVLRALPQGDDLVVWLRLPDGSVQVLLLERFFSAKAELWVVQADQVSSLWVSGSEPAQTQVDIDTELQVADSGAPWLGLSSALLADWALVDSVWALDAGPATSDTVQVQAMDAKALGPMLLSDVSGEALDLVSTFTPVAARLSLDTGALFINARHLAQGAAITGEADLRLGAQIEFVGQQGQWTLRMGVGELSWPLMLPAQAIAQMGEGAVTVKWSYLNAQGQAVGQPYIHNWVIDTQAPAAPAFNAIDELSDGALIQSEALAGVVLSGTAEAGSSVDLLWQDGTVMARLTADASGQWSYRASMDDLGGRRDEVRVLRAVSTDAAGNTGPAAELPLPLRTAPPAAPTANLVDDNPLRWSELATSDVTPTFQGNGPAGGKVLWFVQQPGQTGGREWLAEALVDQSGNYSITLPELAAGQLHTLVVQAMDRYGNESDALTQLDLVLDVTPPGVPVLGAVGEDNRVGFFEFQRGTLVTGQAEAGSRVEIERTQGGVTLTDHAVVAADGSWTFSWLADNWANLTSGEMQVRVRQVDPAGNASGWSDGLSVSVRLTPVPVVQSLLLDQSDDTGLSASDGITSVVRPRLIGQTDPNQTVRLMLDLDGDGAIHSQEAASVLAEFVSDASGFFSWDAWANDLPHGTDVRVLALGWDPLSQSWSNADPQTGLPVNVGQSSQVRLVVDTQAPAAPSIAVVAGDDVIDVAELASGVAFAGVAEAGATVRLRWLDANGQPVGLATREVMADPVSGAWALELNAQELGLLGSRFQIEAVAVDAAGNAGAPALREVNTDNSRPAAPSVLGLSLDTGVSNSDGLTNSAQQVLSGTAVAGSVVTVFNDANNNGVVDAGEALAQVTADAVTGAFQTAPLTFADGQYALRAIARVGSIDSGANQAKVLTVDTVAPTVSISDAAGSEQGPGVINIAKKDTGARFAGQAEDGHSVTIEFRTSDNQLIRSYTVAASAGQWHKNFSPAELADLSSQAQGAVSVVVSQTDRAGNTALISRTVLIDTVAPGGPRSAQAAALAAQANGEIGDGLQWAELVDGVLLQVALPDNLGVGGELTLSWGEESVSRGVSAEELAQGYAVVEVPASHILRAEEGSIPVRVVFRDAAGNVSEPLGVTSDTAATSVVEVDFSGRPPGLQIDPQSFYRLVDGVYHSRAVQGVTLVVSGVAGSVVDVMENGVLRTQVTLDAFGLGSALVQLTPSSLAYQLTAQAPGTGVSGLSLVMDNVRPQAPVLNELEDTLINATERNQGVQISGTCDDRAQINYWLFNTVTGVISETTSILANGTSWSAFITLEQWFQVSDGTLRLFVTQTDWAGNVSDPVERTLTLDTSVLSPVVNTVSDDDRVGAADLLAGVVLRGAAEPGAELVIELQGSAGLVSKTLTAHPQTGAWTLALTTADWTALGEGNVRLSANQTDRAGNVSSNTIRNLVLDLESRGLVLDQLAGDNHLNHAERGVAQTLRGQGEAGSVIAIELGNLTKQVLVGNDGRWSAEFSAQEIASLVDGDRLLVRQDDAAGNSMSTQASISVNDNILAGSLSLSTPSGAVNWASQAAALSLSGSGPVGTQVWLRLAGALAVVEVGPVQVNDSGQWMTSLSSSQMRNVLGAGAVQVQLWATDVSGQQSTALTQAGFTLESSVPTPTLLSIAEDGVINQAEKLEGVSLSGTGVAANTIEITLTSVADASASVVRTLQVPANGIWSMALRSSDYVVLGEGAITAKVVQLAGGVQSVPLVSSFVVDTVAPSAPLAASVQAAQTLNNASDLAGGVTAAEAVDGVLVHLPLSANAAAGDTVELFWGSAAEPVLRYVLRPGDVAGAGGSRVLGLTVPGDEIALRGSALAGDLAISYRITDAAGNADVQRTLVSNLTVVAPPQAPQINAVASDGYINQQEYQQAGVAPLTLTGQANGSGAMTLVLTGPAGNLTFSPQVSAGAWSQALTQADLDALGEGVVGVSAQQVVSGVTSPLATASFVFDKTLPSLPSAANEQAALEKNTQTELAGGLLATSNSNYLTEAYDGTVMHVPLAADAAPGEALRVFWNSQQGMGGTLVEVVLSSTDVLRGYAAVLISEEVITQQGDSNNLLVEAQSVDRAGNQGPRYSVWNGPVDAVPTRPLLDMVGVDGLLNAAEMAAPLEFAGQSTPGLRVEVQLIKGLRSISTLLQADSQGRWSWVLNETETAALQQFSEGVFEFRARQIDQPLLQGATGNPSRWASANVLIDTIAPTLPRIDNVTPDNRIGSSEALSPNGVRITGTGEAGATLSLSFNSNASSVLTKSGISVRSDGTWDVVLTQSDFTGWPSNTGAAGVDIVLQARQTDVAGNASEWESKTFKYSDDQVFAPGSIEVESGDLQNFPQVLQDGFFNNAEASAGLKIVGTGDAGRFVRVTVTVGELVTNLPLVEVDAQGQWAILLEGASLAALGQGTAFVSALQRNGDTENADESPALNFNTSFVIDTTEPTIQASSLSVVDAQGQALSHAGEGDVLLVKVRLSEAVSIGGGTPEIQIGLAGPAVYDAVRSAELGANWLVFAYTTAAGDSALEGTLGSSGWTIDWNNAAVTDAAGNAVAGSAITPQVHNIRVDTVAPDAPSVLDAMTPALGETHAADTAGSPGAAVINLAELVQGKAQVRVNLANGVLANDVLHLEFRWNNASQTAVVQKTLLAADIAQGFALVNLPIDDLTGLEVADLQARAQVVDVSRNASAWSDWSASWTLDTLAPVAPVIGAVATDDRMSAVERDSLTPVSVTGLQAGTVVESWIEGVDAATSQTVRRDVTVSGGQISAVDLEQALNGFADGTWSLHVRQTDVAGNVSTTSTKTVALDTNVPGNPVLTVSAANDGWVNIAETANGLSVSVDLRNTRTMVGDELVFRWTGADNDLQTHRHTLVSGQPDTVLNLLLPAAYVTQRSGVVVADPFNLSVQIEDTGGNTSGLSVLSGKRLDTFVAEPLIDVSSLQTVTAVAAKSNGVFSGTGAEPGATVQVLLTSSTTGQVRRMSTQADNSGVYTFTLTPTDYKDLGGANATSSIAVTVSQTDRAGNTSTETAGSFRLDLALSPPTFFDLTGDNLISAAEVSSGQTLRGTGSAGATLSLQFFDANAADNAPALLTLNGITVNASTGGWSTALTASQLTTLAGGSSSSRTIRTVAVQALDGSVSDPGTLQFVVDMTTPLITGLSSFDANGDGGNNDGLVLTLSEPVNASLMSLLSTYSAGSGEFLGAGVRIEAIDTVTLNGSTYAQQFRMYLGNSHTLGGGEVLSLLAANVVDMRGNAATADLTVTVPSLAPVGRPTPPLVIGLDNVVSDAEAALGVNMSFAIPATQSPNSVLRLFVNGVQTQVTYNGNAVMDVPLAGNQTTANVTMLQANWGVDGSKTVTAQVVINPGTANERSSMFSTSKIAVLDTVVEGTVNSMVLVQHDGDNVLEQGERIRLTFKESVKLGVGTLNSVFGAGATLSAVAPFNGYAQQWDLTLGANPTALPGQSHGLSAGVLTSGVRYVMVRNNPSPVDPISFGELIVLDANGINIARGKPVTASSSWNAQYDKSKIVDGDATGSETSTWGSATSGDQWVQVDLGQVYDINAIVVVPRNNFEQGKSFTVFAGGTDMSSQSYAALSGNASLYQFNYSSSTALVSPLVLGQAVVSIDTAGNIAGSVMAPIPADLMSLPKVGYIDAVSTDNVLSAADMLASSVDVKVTLDNALQGDTVKLYMDGELVGSRILDAADVSTGWVNVAVARNDWGADGERLLNASVERNGVSSEFSLARTVYVHGDHAHWTQVRPGSAIWFDPDNLAAQGLGAAVTGWQSSAGGSTASNTDASQRPTLIMVNGRYALNFDGTNDNLNYTDPLSIIPVAQSNTVGYDISGFVAIQSQTAFGGFRAALSYWGNTPGSGVARGVKLGILDSRLTYTTYSLLDFFGPSNSVSPNATSVLTLRDYYDSSASAYRMQGYNLNVQDINQTGDNSRVNMTVAPTALRIGADTNYGIRAFWQGMIGDAIWLNYKVSDAQMYEIQTYLAAKYASVGFWVTQATNGVYRLDGSAQSSPLIDQRVDFRDVVASETVKIAGADYVETGRGDDVVQIKDLFFRYVDGGHGLDTLQWSVDYNGPSSFVLADFVSNYRGVSGNSFDDVRVNAAGYHKLAGFERLDLRQVGLVSGAVERQVITVAAADVKQLNEGAKLEVQLGASDVLKTVGFSLVNYGNFTLNGQFYAEQHIGLVDGVAVELYVRGGRPDPDPVAVSLNSNSLQLDFNTALTGAEPILADFDIASWGVSRSVDLTGIASLNNRQSFSLEFLSALTSPVKIEYRGSSLRDEFGREFGHKVWGVGSDASDILDASGWDAAQGAVLLAGGGNDRVTGTAGRDMLVGGYGADTLTGGTGSDHFVYRAIAGAGGTGGLGGTSGDVIVDFNTSRNSTEADVLDLADLFELEPGDVFSGDAQADTRTLLDGGYIDLVRVNSGRDLQVWVDRDGGGVTGLLVTLKDIGTGPASYFSVENESSEQLLQRLLTEGRVQVTHA